MARSTGYVVIELKTGKFQPEYAGKLNFYTALVDDRLRREAHADTVGILICGSKNDHTVRYSLGRATSPMAVASYTYDALPAEVRNELRASGRTLTPRRARLTKLLHEVIGPGSKSAHIGTMPPSLHDHQP